MAEGTYGLMDRWRSLSVRTQIVVMLVFVAGLVGLLYLVANTDGTEPGSALAASACVAVVDAGRETAAGSRSMSSYLALLSDKEGDMRSAVALNERYRPLLVAIVSLRTALTAGGDPGPAARLLASECG